MKEFKVNQLREIIHQFGKVGIALNANDDGFSWEAKLDFTCYMCILRWESFPFLVTVEVLNERQ